MFTPDQSNLLQFICDTAPQVAVKSRISIYRGVADFLNAPDHKNTRAQFVTMAAVLEEADARCAQLQLNLFR